MFMKKAGPKDPRNEESKISHENLKDSKLAKKDPLAV